MRRSLAPVCAAMGVLLASCTGSADGSPSPDTSNSPARSSTSAPESSLPANVPQVTNPIEMTQYKKHPCRALTESQLQQLSVPVEGEPQLESVAGPECEWNAHDETGIVISGTTITAGSSLAGSYAKNKRGGYKNFKPITVAGYPGFLYWDGKLNCSVAVGVRNDLLYSIVVGVDTDEIQPGKHCEIAEKAAELATKTMSGRS